MTTVVRHELARHDGDSATLSITDPDSNGMWKVEVRPANERAARFRIVGFLGSDELSVDFGETHEYVWGDPPALGKLVGDLANAVFGGRIWEAGPLGDSGAVLRTESGRKLRMGSFGLPVRWHRTKRTYEPYS